MPEAELDVLETLKTLDVKPKDTTFLFKKEEVDIKNRIEMLFGKKPEKSAEGKGEG